MEGRGLGDGSRFLDVPTLPSWRSPQAPGEGPAVDSQVTAQTLSSPQAGCASAESEGGGPRTGLQSSLGVAQFCKGDQTGIKER